MQNIILIAFDTLLLLEGKQYLLRDIPWQVLEEDGHCQELGVESVFIWVVISSLTSQNFNKIINPVQS